MAATTLEVKGLGKQKLIALAAKAKRLGTTPERYIRSLIEQDLGFDQKARGTTIAELMAPVRAEFRNSGMTENDLDMLVDAARTRHHERTLRKKSKQ